MPKPQEYIFELPLNNRPQDVWIPEAWYPGVQEHIEKTTSSRISDAHLGIKAIVIHATAGSTSEGAMSVMKAHRASWHWLVPDENEDEHSKIVWACSPEARAAWHVKNSRFHPRVNSGKNKVNHWSLGIEIVNRQDKNGNDKFSDWQVEITAQIVRYCWAKYPNLRQVVSHAALDPERRSDPGKVFPWHHFKKLVLNGTDDFINHPSFKMAKHMREITPNKTDKTCCMVL